MNKAANFKHLGSTISSDGDVTSEVRSRIKAVRLKWRLVNSVLCHWHMQGRLKGQIYQTLVLSEAL